MRFLLDENADLRLRPVLLELGHDVTAIAVDYQASISDRDVLDLAYAEGRILITNDRDFGELIFRQHLPTRASSTFGSPPPASPPNATGSCMSSPPTPTSSTAILS
jgi:predicted nuclease of predicted toxin-antitoxin system